MQQALYLSMFDGVNCYSRKDVKRAKKKKLWDRIGKTIAYGAAILAAAIGGDNFMEYATVSTAVCLTLECLR